LRHGTPQGTGDASLPRNVMLEMRCRRTLPLGTLAKPQGGSIGVMLISAYIRACAQ